MSERAYEAAGSFLAVRARLCGGDDGAAKHLLAAIEHGGLSGRDSRGFFQKMYQPSSVAERAEGAGERAAAVADAHGEVAVKEGFVGEAGVLHEHVFSFEVSGRAEHDGVVVGVEADDVGGLAEGDAEPFALPDGVEGDAAVGAERVPFGVDVKPRAGMAVDVGALCAEEVAVVAFDEADLHGFGSLGHLGEASLGEVASDVGFAHVAEREEAAGEGVL